MAAEVVVRVQDQDAARGPSPPFVYTTPINGTSTIPPPYPVDGTPMEVIVRTEEILLVVLVLVIWVAAIALFFNRWGKIRMLEPYQPKFQQQHRSSCPIGESMLSPQQRMSFSKYNVNCMGDSSMYTSLPSPNPMRRQRQNSVFVGSSTMAVMNPPRRVKSAMDIQHMVLSDYSPGSLSGCSSLQPIVTKRPSITIERVQQHPKHRASIVPDQSFMSHHYHRHLPSRKYLRRTSCLSDRPHFGRHKHFISFDQPTTSWDRRTSITIERPSRRQNTLSFDHTGSSSFDQPSLIIEPPSAAQNIPSNIVLENLSKSTAGRSCPESMVCLHHPSTTTTNSVRRPSFHLEMPISSPGRHRLSVSLDNPNIPMDRRSSVDSRSSRSAMSSSFDETQIALSNLEHSKVSDV